MDAPGINSKVKRELLRDRRAGKIQCVNRLGGAIGFDPKAEKILCSIAVQTCDAEWLRVRRDMRRELLAINRDSDGDVVRLAVVCPHEAEQITSVVHDGDTHRNAQFSDFLRSAFQNALRAFPIQF